MKAFQIIAAIVTFFISTHLQGQDTFLDQHFSTQIQQYHFDMQTINSKMFERLAKTENPNAAELKEVISSLKVMKSINKENVDGYTLFDDINSKLEKLNFEELSLRVENLEKVKIFAAPLNDVLVKELIIIKAEKQKFYVLDLVGDIDLNQISKLSNIPGLEHLTKN